MITVICCLCKKEMGTKEGGTGFSHSMCKECGPDYLKKQLESVRELGRLDKMIGQTV